MDYISWLKCSVIMSPVLLFLWLYVKWLPLCISNCAQRTTFSNAIILLVIHFGITRVYVAGYIVLFYLSCCYFVSISLSVSLSLSASLARRDAFSRI